MSVHGPTIIKPSLTWNQVKDLWEARALERDNAEEERAALEAALERAERRRTSVA